MIKRARKKQKVNWEREGERKIKREGLVNILAHAGHGTPGVFVCVLFASEGFMPLSGRGAAETGSLVRHREDSDGGEEEKRE